MEPQYQDKAIQLVCVNQEGKYELHPDAEHFLRQVPKPISVISVAGLYRTGKSYLLNRILLNRNDGFGVGPTINPHTKGLWCWGTPIEGTTQNGEKVNILIVDSEGIGALDEDQNHDIKIFTLAILSSSVFIYNSVGSIDENAIQNLSLVINLTKNIQLTSENEDFDPEDLAEYFPSFFWVVRDFSLQLINSQGETISPKEYLEKALAPQKGFSDDVEEKNRIRRLLTSYFKERECSTLVRPLVNQQKLQHLYDCSFEDLRPQFVEQALNLRKRIFSSTKPKLLKGEYLDGNMYVSMLNSYLACINNGGVPNIENAWTYICIEKCSKLQERCYEFFNEAIEKNIRRHLPCPSEMFETQIEQIEAECCRMFESQQIGEESKTFQIELKQKIKQKTMLLRVENQKESINLLKNYIMKNFTVIEKKMRSHEYDNFQAFQKSINSFYLHLLENGPDLPKKEIVYLDFLKKVTSQAAELFLKQQRKELEALKSISQEKEKLLISDSQNLTTKFQTEIEDHEQKYQTLTAQKTSIEKQWRLLTTNTEDLVKNHQIELSRVQYMHGEQQKVAGEKISKLLLSNAELQQKKETLESSSMRDRRQSQKEAAVMQLRLNQIKDELQSQKLRENSQEMRISDLNYEYSLKLRETGQQFEARINELTAEANSFKDQNHELSDEKQLLEATLNQLEANKASTKQQLQEELKLQTLKFENYKQDFERETIVRIASLEEENSSLNSERATYKNSRTENEKAIKEMNERIKVLVSEHEKEMAISSQKQEFISQQLEEVKDSYTKSTRYYESQLDKQLQAQQQSIRLAHRNEMQAIQEQLTKNLQVSQTENGNLKDKVEKEIQSARALEQKLLFELSMVSRQHEVETNVKNTQIQKLEQQKGSLLNVQQQNSLITKAEFKDREEILLSKIKDLENELYACTQQSTVEQQEMNNRSEESLKQLKNYYQLEKQKLEHKIIVEKDKSERKLAKLREEYQNQLEEEKKTYEEENDTLRDEFNNEGILLKDLVESLQHQNDDKARSLENAENRLREEKQNLYKKEQEFNSRIRILTNTQTMERESLQGKMLEMKEQKAEAEKDLIAIQYQKEELSKDCKELASKYDAKTEQKLSLKTTIDKIQNQHRHKFSELSNEYMNERLNYQKKIALANQENEFVCKKLDDFERQQSKSCKSWEQKLTVLKADFVEEKKEFESRRQQEYCSLQTKYDKLKRTSKENEQKMMRNINTIERQAGVTNQNYLNMSSRYEELESKVSGDSEQLLRQIAQLRRSMGKMTEEAVEETGRLKRELSEVDSERTQLASSHDKMKILTDNKISFLEDAKQKNKKEHLDKIRQLEQTIQTLHKSRTTDKTHSQSLANQSAAKTERKYQTLLQQTKQKLFKREKESESNQKKLQSDIRTLTEKLIVEAQAKQDSIKSLERRVKETEDNQKRAQIQLEQYKKSRQSTSSSALSVWQKQKQTLKLKLHEKEDKQKKLENAKQQLFYEYEKERAKWNLEKDNYSMKNEELKEIIAKSQKDTQRLVRDNQKLKAQKKSAKMNNMSSFSRFSLEKVSSKFNLQDSINSINVSMCKQNSNPLGEISFFNNQQ